MPTTNPNTSIAYSAPITPSTSCTPRPSQQGVLRTATDWRQLRFYQKADTLYQLTFAFCRRFLPSYGDRTVDQMVQAARSGKQNIVEGIEDGKTSSEMELRLLNVARSSLQELREDYEDYLHTRGLPQWGKGSSRYEAMLGFCRAHHHYEHYAPFVERWTAEEYCNTALTLCHIADRMMCNYLARLEQRFVQEGGIKERMHAARTGYRQQQDAQLRQLQSENASLKNQVTSLNAQLASLQSQVTALQAKLAASKN